MSKDTVSITRAKSAPPCELWDGRKTHDESRKNALPLTVTISEAADLLDRDPADWTVPVAADLALVKAESKRRADAAAKAATADGGN